MARRDPISGMHICHLTVLNPARHSRIFFKAARSQVAAGYRVSIIGQDPAPRPYTFEGVQIIPTGRFGRLSWQRWRARRKVIRLAMQEKADVYQIHAPELLLPAQALGSAVPDCRLVYDMHEDYARNIRCGGYYPPAVSGRLADWVRQRELNFVGYGQGVIYAERCYTGLLPFPEDASVVVENKYQAPSGIATVPDFGDSARPLLLYTGTIAESWGVLEAIAFWRDMNTHLPCRLAVVGHTHDRDLLTKIRDQVQDSPQFLLVGGSEYVPYERVIGWIQKADAGLALYRLRENIRDRLPTKFYELLAHGKPVIYSQNPAWQEFFADAGQGMALPLPWQSADVVQIADQFKHYLSAPSPAIPPDEKWSWESEAFKLIQFLGKLPT
ncbi:MAG: hypothetical protein AAF998_07520 [Bacteroidota bacterium]